MRRDNRKSWYWFQDRRFQKLSNTAEQDRLDQWGAAARTRIGYGRGDAQMWLKYRCWVDKTVEIRKLEGLAPEQAESVPKGSSSRQGDAGTRRLTSFWAK